MSDTATSHPEPGGRRHLLVWDDPDMRATIQDVLVSEAPVDNGPDLERVYLWLAERAAEGEATEACLFTAVRPGDEEATAAAVTKIRMSGFSVLAKIQPTLGRADLSGAMWSHIESQIAAGDVAEVIVASHDGAAFGPRLAGLAQRGIAVTVLGFRERAGYAAGRAGVAFVDVESVPGAYRATLPRTNLYDLPSEGRLLPPLRRPPAPVGAASADVVTAPAHQAPAPPLVASPAAVPVGGTVIDLTSEEHEPAPVMDDAAPPPPPPPPPPWAAAPPAPVASADARASRPGRVMPPNNGA